MDIVPTPAQAVDQPNPELSAPAFNIQRVFIKGSSFEMPHAPQIFLEQLEMDVALTVVPAVAVLAKDIYEVTLRGTVEAKDRKSGRVFFLLEIDQAGIFELRNVPAEHMAELLDVRCPNILLGYLRVQVSDTLARATLPVINLPEYDWAAIAHQTRASAAAAAAQGADPRIIH